MTVQLDPEVARALNAIAERDGSSIDAIVSQLMCCLAELPHDLQLAALSGDDDVAHEILHHHAKAKSKPRKPLNKIKRTTSKRLANSPISHAQRPSRRDARIAAAR